MALHRDWDTEAKLFIHNLEDEDTEERYCFNVVSRDTFLRELIAISFHFLLKKIRIFDVVFIAKAAKCKREVTLESTLTSRRCWLKSSAVTGRSRTS